MPDRCPDRRLPTAVAAARDRFVSIVRDAGARGHGMLPQVTKRCRATSCRRAPDLAVPHLATGSPGGEPESVSSRGCRLRDRQPQRDPGAFAEMAPDGASRLSCRATSFNTLRWTAAPVVLSSGRWTDRSTSTLMGQRVSRSMRRWPPARGAPGWHGSSRRWRRPSRAACQSRRVAHARRAVRGVVQPADRRVPVDRSHAATDSGRFAR